jgi:hypothetical protein
MNRNRKLLTAMFASLVLSIGISKVGFAQTVDIKSFTIIPPADIASYTFENKRLLRSAFIFLGGAVGQSLAAQDSNNEGSLNATLDSLKLELPKELTNAVKVELEKTGFQATVMKDIQRSKRWPDWFEYEKLTMQTDAFLHLKIEVIGITSPRFSERLLPQMDVSAAIILKNKSKAHASSWAYFGLNVPDEDRALSAKRNFSQSFTSVQEIGQDPARIVAMYQSAIPNLAKRIAEEIYDALF